MDIYLHSPIRLHGVALNSLNTEITFPSTFTGVVLIFLICIVLPENISQRGMFMA
jgi:hypothetical protein